jgi:hypothetical protein
VSAKHAKALKAGGVSKQGDFVEIGTAFAMQLQTHYASLQSYFALCRLVEE